MNAEIESGHSIEERRKAAVDQALIRSYEAYRDAYYRDLNKYYPGLNALQLGSILLDLAAEEFWYDAFADDERAEKYRSELEKEVTSFKSLIPMAVSAAIERMEPTDKDLVWAKISQADVAFLTNSGRPNRVIKAYKDAVPQRHPFAWNAAKGQLRFFQELGVNEKLARAVIEELDHYFIPPDKNKDIHLIIFAGHRMDEDDRVQPRFPAKLAPKVKNLLRDKIKTLSSDEYETKLLASAALGSDILAHEVCAELGISSTICLPMPTEDFAKVEFTNRSKWRNRFLDLAHKLDVLTLSNADGLPAWLAHSNKNPWERGNQWVLNMALTSGAKRITLVAFWDGKSQGDAPGGTAQMVKLAEDSGKIYIEIIDSNQILTKSDKTEVEALT